MRALEKKRQGNGMGQGHCLRLGAQKGPCEQETSSQGLNNKK